MSLHRFFAKASKQNDLPMYNHTNLKKKTKFNSEGVLVNHTKISTDENFCYMVLHIPLD